MHLLFMQYSYTFESQYYETLVEMKRFPKPWRGQSLHYQHFLDFNYDFYILSEDLDLVPIVSFRGNFSPCGRKVGREGAPRDSCFEPSTVSFIHSDDLAKISRSQTLVRSWSKELFARFQTHG